MLASGARSSHDNGLLVDGLFLLLFLGLTLGVRVFLLVETREDALLLLLLQVHIDVLVVVLEGGRDQEFVLV